MFPDYPAVFSVWGATKRDEATRFADLVKFLADNGVIEDYSQVALLLHSVRIDHSGPYLDALEQAGIPVLLSKSAGVLRERRSTSDGRLSRRNPWLVRRRARERCRDAA